MNRSLTLFACALFALAPGSGRGQVAGGPDPVFDAPAPLSMAELARCRTEGVSAVEVKDYAAGNYRGALRPSPPHADLNPRKAVIVFWKGHAHRFVFSHEASYCPWLELPGGAGMANQFFEGNLGDAELFNNPGRKEKNSFVDIIEGGPRRVWVRWNYFCVNMTDDSQPRLRGTEDYIAYPNGLVWRRMKYESLMPEAIVGYSTQPVELFGVAPGGAGLRDLFPRDAEHGDYHALSAVDAYTDRRYDIYWDESGKVRRRGDDSLLAAISRSPGYALVIPFKARLLFAAMGPASGFPAEKSQLIDHCTSGAQGGAGWGAGRWDHWPIGWLNSQTSYWKPGTPYPYSFGSIGHFLVPDRKRIQVFWRDYSEYCKDMELNRWTAQRAFYVLLGTAHGWDDVRRIARAWLDKGPACARPESIADLK
jgi:hypothetical protein